MARSAASLVPLALLLACGSRQAAAPSRLAEAGAGPAPAGLAAGDPAPRAIVESETGAHVELGERWSSGVTAVVFYRGNWCPHCRAQLTELEQHKEELEAAGVKLVALSVDVPDDAAKLRKRLGLSFDVYSDRGKAALHGFRVEDPGKGIARPAMFLVAGGKIAFAYVGQNPSDHPTVAQLLEAVHAYQAKDPG